MVYIFRVKNVEDELLKARNDSKRFQANFEGLIHEMVAEVDALMEIAASGSKEKQKVRLDWRSIKFALKFKHCIIVIKMYFSDLLQIINEVLFLFYFYRQ